MQRSRFRNTVRAVVGSCWLSFALACAPAAPPRPPDLLLIVIDTLRADHLGVYGYPRPTSPNLDRLALGGSVFTNAMAPSSWTKPSIASLFTSRHPSEHAAVSFRRHLDPAVPTLAGELRAAGYRTVGVSGNFVHVNETTGLSRGFEVFSAPSSVTATAAEALLTLDEHGATVHRRAASAMELNTEVDRLLEDIGDAPLFLYVHYMEPHSSYAPPEPFLSRFAREPGRPDRVTSNYLKDLATAGGHLDVGTREWIVDRYDAEIATVDAAVGALLDSLAARDRGRTIVVVASDHGEEFGEHGGWFHGRNLQAESLRVPLLFHDAAAVGALRSGAGAAPAQVRSEAVDLLDVAPTLLALAGAPPAAGMRGRDLFAPAVAARELVAELHDDPLFERRLGVRVQRFARIAWPWKVILSRDRAPEIYDLERDPAERTPVAPGTTKAARAALRATLDRRARWRNEYDAGNTRKQQGAAPDAETLEGLRALGYID